MSKEIRTKLDIYVDYLEGLYKNDDHAKEVIYNRIGDLLEKAGFEYQIYEQEIQ